MPHTLTIAQLTDQLANKKLSSREATQACLERIDDVDHRLNAFINLDPEQALAQADTADTAIAQGRTHAEQPLLGVPIAIKDVIAVQNQPLNCASKILGNFNSPYESTVTGKLRNAGAVVFGRLNMDEFAMGSSTENSAFGPSRNPWDTERIPGGSSGGSAVAVAADECIASLGSDTGGSIRQPAAFCGVVGVKPSYGRVSRYGAIAFASSLDQIGPLARSARGAAEILQVIAGHDKRDSTCSDAPTPDYTSELHGGSSPGGPRRGS
mgnify:CR=1 FL=1